MRLPSITYYFYIIKFYIIPNKNTDRLQLQQDYIYQINNLLIPYKKHPNNQLFQLVVKHYMEWNKKYQALKRSIMFYTYYTWITRSNTF